MLVGIYRVCMLGGGAVGIGLVGLGIVYILVFFC